MAIFEHLEVEFIKRLGTCEDVRREASGRITPCSTRLGHIVSRRLGLRKH